MIQPSDDQTHDTQPPVEIKPTLKMALYIKQLQNLALSNSSDWETAIKAWDECGLTLGNDGEKKELP